MAGRNYRGDVASKTGRNVKPKIRQMLALKACFLSTLLCSSAERSRNTGGRALKKDQQPQPAEQEELQLQAQPLIIKYFTRTQQLENNVKQAE